MTPSCEWWARVFTPTPWEQQLAAAKARLEGVLLDIGILCGLSRQEVMASLQLEYRKRNGGTPWTELVDIAQRYAAQHGTLPFMVVADGARLFPDSIISQEGC